MALRRQWHENCYGNRVVAILSTEQGLLLRFDSDITFVDYAVDIVDNLMSYAGYGHRTNLLVVTRELLKNAVVHGNRNDADKAVVLRLKASNSGGFRIEVEDGGEGLEAEGLQTGPRQTEGPQGSSGFSLIKALARRIEVNAANNRITVFMDP